MPTRNWVNYKKDKPKDIHTKTDNRFMKTNIKEEILNAANDISLKGKNNANDRFLIRNHGEQRKCYCFFWGLEKKKKELLTENSASSENILDENHSVLRWRKTKRNCHQHTIPKIIAKGNSLNRKEVIKKSWNTRKEETTMESKTMDEQLKWKFQHCPMWFSICVEEIFRQL